MKKIFLIFTLVCILIVLVSISLNAQVSDPEIVTMAKVGGMQIDDGSGYDANEQGVPETEFEGFNAYVAFDPQYSMIFSTLAKRSTDKTLSAAQLDIDSDSINEIAVTLNGIANTVLVIVDTNENGIIGDLGDESIESVAGMQSVANLILPGGDMISVAAGVDEYNENLFTQFSFEPIGTGTIVVTEDTGFFVTFEFPPTEGSCIDGIDNDGDSFADCEDIDCVYEPACDAGKNKIGYDFRLIRAEAEEVEGSLTGEVQFDMGISPRHHEAAFTDGAVHWSVTPMISSFEMTASTSVTPAGGKTQIIILSKADDWYDDPGYGGNIGVVLENDDFAIIKAIMEAYAKGCQDPVIEISNVGTLEITQTVGSDTYTDVIPADKVRISGWITTMEDGLIDYQGSPLFKVKDVKIVSFAPTTNLISAPSSTIKVKLNSEIEFTGVLRDLVKDQYSLVNKQVSGVVDITDGPIPGKLGSDFEISGPAFIKRIN